MMPIPKPPTADASLEVHEHYALTQAMPVLREAVATMGVRGSNLTFYWPYREHSFGASGYLCQGCNKAHGQTLYLNEDGEMVVQDV